MADASRRQPGRAIRALFALVVVTAAALGLAAAGACLPGLASLPPEPSAFDGAALGFVGCGDGIIATLDDGGDAGESCDPGGDAAVKGCASCQIQCEGKLDPRSGHCYFAVAPTTTYNEAVRACKDELAHVVTFGSVEEVGLVEAVAPGDEGYWVGLVRSQTLRGAYEANRPEEPGLAYPLATDNAGAGPCEGCFGIGTDAGVMPFADGVDASDPTLDTSCVAARGAGWFRVPCSGSAALRTVCEREPEGKRAQDCNGGFCFTVPATLGAKTYLVIVSASGPETAAQTCSDLDGGSLVVLESRQEREQLAHEIYARNPDKVEQLWIGLTENGGVWSWADGVVASAGGERPLPWGNAQPEGGGGRAFMRVGATAYDTQLAYADDGGASQRIYVCQRPAR